MKNKSIGKFTPGTTKSGKFAMTAIMILLTITFLYPLYYMVVNSLKTADEYYLDLFALPGKKSIAELFENYTVMLIEFKILRYFKNSMIVSLSSCALILLFSVFASYAFAKIPFRGKGIAYMFVLATMFMPGQATLIPQYVMFSKYKLINNYWSVILANLSGGVPGAIMLMRAAFFGVPNDLLESAKIDGAGYFRTVFNVMVPVSLATMAIVTINNFISSWNDLLTPMLFLSNAEKQTVMVSLQGMVGRYSSLPTRQLTGILLSVVPTVILYLCLQKYMVKGVMVGAVKG